MTKTEKREKLNALSAQAANAEGESLREINNQITDVKMDILSDNVDELRELVEKANKREEKRDVNAYLREVLKGVRESKQAREITLGTAAAKGQILESGAVALTIHDIIPTLNEGLGLPAGIKIVTGVTGNELWPVSVDDAKIEEVGETATLSAQDLNFDNIQPTAFRGGIRINVSNTAIDNADFDLLGFIQGKITLALKKYLAEKLYSQAAFTGNKGPFSGLAAAGSITLDANAYKNILKAVAAFTDKGFDSSKVCLVMDATTEAELKATPKAAGQGGFIIENGKCAGYDYVVSHYINTKLKGGSGSDANNLIPTTDKSIGIGYFDYEALQQHGTVRLVVDATSENVAMRNITAVVMNTAWSFTDLSKKLNEKGGTTTKAFARYTVVQPA